MITQKDAQAAVKKHGSQRKAALALGVAQSSLSEVLTGKRSALEAGRQAPAREACGRTLADFRRAHDKSYIVPNKIRAALAALGGGWEYELPFAKAAGVSLADLSAFRSMFEDHIVVVEKSKRAWAGTKASAARMREMVT